MRKLLLATAAVMSGSMGVAQIASAQSTPAPTPTVVPTPSVFTLAPSPTPGPGTVTVRLNARVNFYAAAGSDSGRNPGTVTPVASSATSLGSPQTNTKLANYDFYEYARLYPGFDGIAGNGLKYGGAMEIRQDNGEAPGGGVNGSISQNSRNRNALYVRVAYVYLGTDTAGFLRLGSTYGAATLHITGTFENFDSGGWDGDGPGLFTSNSQPFWPFPDIGVLYTTTKAVYVSPQFYGADFAASFEPNTGNGQSGPGNCPYGVTANGGITGPIGGGLQGLGCDAASSTSSGDYARRRNTVDASVRYRGAFGPIGVAANVATILSGKVADNAAPARATQYDGLRLVNAGGIVTFGGLAVGGNIIAGRGNGSFNLDPRGQRDEFAYLIGASYAVGPVIVGGSFYDYMSAGSKNATSSPLVGNRNEYGIAAGGTYTFAPGMNIYLSYLYGHRKEVGVDLLSGATSSGTTTAGLVSTHNNVQSQGISIGTQFRW